MMKITKYFASVALFSVISFGAFAQTISATASTHDGAEARIAALAAKQGQSYKILSAINNNRVHITAELTK